MIEYIALHIVFATAVLFLGVSIAIGVKQYVTSSIFRNESYHLLNTLLFAVLELVLMYIQFFGVYSYEIKGVTGAISVFGMASIFNFIVATAKHKGARVFRLLGSVYMITTITILIGLSLGSTEAYSAKNPPVWVLDAVSSATFQVISKTRSMDAAYTIVCFILLSCMVLLRKQISNLFNKKWLLVATIALGINGVLSFVNITWLWNTNHVLGALDTLTMVIGIGAGVIGILKYFKVLSEIRIQNPKITPTANSASIFESRREMLTEEEAVTYFREEITKHIEKKIQVTRRILATYTSPEDVKRLIDFEYKNITLSEMVVFSKKRTIAGDLGEIMFDVLKWDEYMQQVYKIALSKKLSMDTKENALRAVMISIVDSTIIPEIRVRARKNFQEATASSL